MTAKERSAILQFMRLVLNNLHPNLNEYPIQEMKQVESTVGDEFERTQYQDAHHLIEAYYMNDAIEKLEYEGRKF